MTPLPYDYSRCVTPCVLSEQCRRTTPGHPTYQVYTAFKGGLDCDGFYPEIEVKK